MKLSISENKKTQIFEDLRVANQNFNAIYRGDREDRQPIHTVYGGADLFKFDTAKTLGKIALKSFLQYAPNCIEFGKAFQLNGYDQFPSDENEIEALIKTLNASSKEDLKTHFAGFSHRIYHKVIDKLQHEGVEDFRIDFEDGFGNRTDQEEDETAVFAAEQVAKGMTENSLSPFIGIRIKPFTEELKERGLRTLDLFLTALLKASGGKLPENFVVMLPKVTIPAQIVALVSFFEVFEHDFNLEHGALKMEMMVETTQSIMDHNGTNPLFRFILASKGRCIATHFGTYDYTASNNITAKYQEMDHDVCDYAHYTTKVALAHTGIWLSDGATNTMPIGPHRGDLSPDQKEENKMVVHRAWLKGYGHIRHSLYKGLYQGWDLNPAQLPMRYTAVYAFFLESYDDAVIRLKTFIEKAAQATLIGDTFDDAATGQGLLNYFLKALNSGAITIDEVLATGLTLDEIRTRSFAKIIKDRRANSQ
ncbi:MAG: phosphoenolpyruvate kinase [Flavobacteriaceae bacterium]|nr:phosphoenolpyruvate kinase [Flavobacteriaceae bacterium]